MLTMPFFGLIYQKEIFDSALDELTQLFQSKRRLSPSFPFTATEYYESEMGKGLMRCWLAFLTQFDPEELVELKKRAVAIEVSLSVEGRRRVNIDPGYLDLKRVVLSTHKDAAHRIYLGDGIYAEVTLIYYNKSFRPLPWTYPDYRWEETINFFNSLRQDVSGLGRREV
ncbi:DUF4416 domain-containing protein [candidate division WOR-3 bacterium]|uniref:DUF4416 domain-containing protein n=1 Tax=candidate division WOR-3 bacterium TaxID=2052148 RepID=A0A660SI12_UNCW3|nr:MAG: DUF4416 domain-containing protein [candidate division WOR-3 bacterium]